MDTWLSHRHLNSACAKLRSSSHLQIFISSCIPFVGSTFYFHLLPWVGLILLGYSGWESNLSNIPQWLLWIMLSLGEGSAVSKPRDLSGSDVRRYHVRHQIHDLFFIPTEGHGKIYISAPYSYDAQHTTCVFPSCLTSVLYLMTSSFISASPFLSRSCPSLALTT